MFRLAETFRRFIVICALAFWLGGFAFYTGVVVQVGAAVLKSHVRQGFITQRVTFWLNMAGVTALAAMLWDLLAAPGSERWPRRVLWIAWWMIALLQIWLFSLHPFMDRLLNPKALQILDEDKFIVLHTTYVWSATVQWGMGVVFLFMLLWSWTLKTVAQASSL
jgi:hypothetical protein